MTIQLNIPALREIGTASKLNFSRFTQLMKEAAPYFVEAGYSSEDALSILEETLLEREQPVELGKRRDEAYGLLCNAMEAETQSIFAAEAPALRESGYSPLPRNPKENRPAIKAWSDRCEKQPGEKEIAAWSRIADISLACGYGGLLAIDVDDDRPEILVAVGKALPHCTVARRGSKGFVLLVRHADGPRHTVNIYRADEARRDPLVEIMGLGRSIAIPASIHAKTGKAYQWTDPVTGKPRPAEWQIPALADLPVVTGADTERLIAALMPVAFPLPVPLRVSRFAQHAPANQRAHP